MSEPFFLLGAERAGLLLVELMVAAHPELGWGGDFDYALEWPEPVHAEWPPLVPYWQQIAFSKRARELGLLIDPALAFPALVRSLLAQQRRGAQRPFGVVAHQGYDRILRLWPEARFVYVLRSATRGADPAVAECLRTSDLAWRRVAAQIPPERRIELRYDTLLTNLPTELARVCGFLGVSFDSGLLRAPHAASLSPGDLPAEAAPSRMLRFAHGLGSRLARRLRG